MSRITPQMRTLSLAVQDYGGATGLAKALCVPDELLSSWLRGEEEVPSPIYLRVLDLVAMGR